MDFGGFLRIDAFSLTIPSLPFIQLKSLRRMGRTTKAILLLPIFFLVALSCTSPSKRNLVEFVLEDGSKVHCAEPPPDVVARGIKVNAEVAAEKIGNLLKGTGGVDVDIERIRQELPSDVAAFEAIEFRICLQYGNRVLTKEEYRAFTDRILPTIKQSTSENLVSQLTVEGVDDPFGLIPQTNQPLPPIATKLAKIRVQNIGQRRVFYVGVTVVEMNGHPLNNPCQLAVSTMDTVFINPKAPLPKVSADLNPGEDVYFDAVIECNGNSCPKGAFAIPCVYNGRIMFWHPVKNNEASQLKELTVRVFGDSSTTVATTFRVRKLGSGGYLSLHAI